MKSKRVLTGVGSLFVLSMLAACGGGGGGGGGGGAAPGPTPPVTGTFIKTFGPASTIGNSLPFGTDFAGDAKLQTLYTAAEIGAAGRITALRFFRSDVTPSITCPNTTIRLGHTSLSAPTATFGTNVNQGRGTQRTVLDNTTATIPAGATGTWFEIPFAVPFEYNGVDNLVVEVERTTACSGEAVIASVNASGNRRAFAFNTDNTPGTADHDTTTAFPVDTTLLLQQFVFSGGDNKIDLGGTDNNIWPFANTAVVGNERPRIQNLYLASEINGSGPITGVAFQLNDLSVAGSYTYTLKLGHSTRTTLGVTFASNYAGSPVTVANAVSFDIPANITAGEWVWVPIPNGVFTYNGTDNLIVEVATSAGSVNTNLRAGIIAGRRVYVNDTLGTATTGAVDDVAYHIALRFHGGTMDVHTPEAMSSASSDIFPFYGTDNKRQYLYRAAELGTKGNISKIACRAGSGGDAETGFNYTVVLSHTSASALSGNFAASLTSPVTVFNGSFDLPAVAVGDWIEVPLTTAFAYNGVDNLVVQFGGTGGADFGFACAVDGAARYADRRLISFPSSAIATDGIVTAGLPDMRFTLE